MNLTGNAEFITGGASGIGHALAATPLETGNEVMICGRDRDKLKQAREAHSGRAGVGCDLARDHDTEETAEAVHGRHKMAPEQLAREVIARLAARRHEIPPGSGRWVFSIHRPAPALLGRKMRRARGPSAQWSP